MGHRPRPTRPGRQRESCLTFEPVREGGVLAYLVSRHPAAMEDANIPIDGRVGRESARQGLAKALRWMDLEVLVGDEMCFPLFRPIHTKSTV